MGTGADDMVASAHAMSIGVGEVIGPMLGGYFVELLPTSLVSQVVGCFRLAREVKR